MSRSLPIIVVITGASSGIGRATAHALAERGSKLVLAARRGEVLNEVVRECAERGGEALAVPTDVTREDEVQALAAHALDRFGRIDVWFNNAGIGVFGELEVIPSDVWRRVIETNVIGYMYGAKAALAVFRRQGHGVLINNASIVGRTAKPDSTAYATSKFAVRGFSEALRQELLDAPDIHVCTILPAVIDTPFFEHAANFSGQKVRAAPPVYAPDKVAETVVHLSRHPKPETIICGAGQVLALQKRLAPRFTTWLTGRVLHRGFLAEEPAASSTGIAFEPARDGLGVTGGWRKGANNGGAPTFALLAILLPLALLAARRKVIHRRWR